MRLSDESIRSMIVLYEKDYRVLCDVSDRLTQHLNELESDKEHYDNFVKWSGTQILMHALVMCRTKTLGIIEDLKGNLTAEGEVIPLRLVENSDEQK